MPRTTLADAKSPSSGIARVLNLDPTDARFVFYLNECQQRLVMTGELFWGLTGMFQFCVTDGCITLPRQIATVESAAVCNRPIPIHNAWFQFLENGPGIQDAGACNGGTCNVGCNSGAAWNERRGEFCTFADVRGANKKIRVYTDVSEDDSAKILLFGTDENGNWIRSETTPGSGVWQDGIYVSLSGGPNLSSKFFTSLTGVQKPETNGAVRLYEYDTVLTTQRALAIYEPSEKNPSYRRSLVTSICPGADCDTVQVTVMAKLEFIPAKVDTDWLLIGNIPALKDMCQSIRKAEANLFDEATQWEARAVQCLRRELSHYRGHGVVTPIRLVPRAVGGPGTVNMI